MKRTDTLGRGLLLATATAATGWLALWSWHGMVAEPDAYLGPAVTGAALVALTGAGARWLRWSWPAVIGAQVTVAALWLQSRASPSPGPAAWIPDTGSIGLAAEHIATGAADLNRYAAPVAAEHQYATEYLLATGLLAMLAMDLLAWGWRRPGLAGMPLVVVLAVPISVLDRGLNWVVLAAVGAGFALILALAERERSTSWAAGSETALPPGAASPPLASAAKITAPAIAIALIVPLFIPLGAGILDGRGNGGGSGADGPVRLINPLVDLHRDLVQGGGVPLVEATTADPDPTYLRLTVLDVFDGTRWRPSDRELLGRNRADGELPAPPGLDSTVPTESATWRLRLAETFQTAWLPTPYPLASVETEDGDWRFNEDTRDFHLVGSENGAGTRYRLTTLRPDITPADLRNAPPAPTAVAGEMTRLPADIPAVLGQTARRVTATAPTLYGKAALLQDWFRSSGGFVYSLRVDPGSASDALERFITTDKVGYCEQFAAAMALMARSLGIPSRVVVGLLRPEKRDGENLLYTSDGLHAWPELYFSGAGWVRFEPTPSSRSGRAPAWTRLPRENVEASPAPTAAPTPTTAPSAAPEPGAPASASTSAGGSPRLVWLGAAIAILGALALSLTPLTIRRRQRQRRLRPPEPGDAAAGAGGLWGELRATADDARIDLTAGGSLRRMAAELADAAELDPDQLAEAQGLVDFIERARFGPPEMVGDAVWSQMAGRTAAWAGQLVATRPRWSRIRAWVIPRSVWRQGPGANALADEPLPQLSHHG